MAFHWDESKNEWLKRERNISFERIVVGIEEGHLIDVLEHPNTTRYPNQWVLVVEIEGYAFCVPCIPEKEGDYFLKTVFPSRRYTRHYRLGGEV